MKTTLEIEEEILALARERAAERGQTLDEIVSEALKASFSPRNQKQSGPFVMPVFGPAGERLSRDPGILSVFRDEGR